MSRYFVIVHSLPEGGTLLGGPILRELAALLSKDESALLRALEEFPAIVASGVPQVAAETLSDAIERLGGIAEIMAEGSGVFDLYSSSPANLVLSSGRREPAAAEPAPKQERREPAPELLPPKDTGPNERPSSSAQTVASEPPKPPAGSRPPIVHAAPAAGADDPPSRSFARLLAWKVNLPKNEEADDHPAQRLKRSFSSLTVFSPFARKGDAESAREKRQRKRPRTEMERRAAALRSSGAGSAASPQAGRRAQEAAVFGLLLILLLVSMGFLFFEPESELLEQGRRKHTKLLLLEGPDQDENGSKSSARITGELAKLPRTWHGEVCSEMGTLRVVIGATAGAFDSGSVELTITAAPARPVKRGDSAERAPRITFRQLVVKKLHAAGTPRELAGAGKAIVLNDGYQEQIDASVVVTINDDSLSEVISGTVEIFSPSRTPGENADDVMEEDTEGELHISLRRRFSARFNPAPSAEQGETGEGASAVALPPAI